MNKKIIEKLKKIWKNIKNEWDEERANDILNYYIENIAICYNYGSHKEIRLEDKDINWNATIKHKKIRIKDIRFWKKYGNANDNLIKKYLIEKFNYNEFEKKINTYKNGDIEVVFKKKFPITRAFIKEIQQYTKDYLNEYDMFFNGINL